MDYGAMVLTSQKTGIKSAPQSKFHWSKRRVRWSIMKELVQHKKVSLHDMKQKYTHASFDQIIQSMIDDDLIELHDDEIRVAW